jgi:hypothetical protein
LHERQRIQHKRKNHKAEAPIVPQEPTESTPHEYSAKPQESQELEHSAYPQAPPQEPEALVEPTRGTLDETIVNPEEKEELEPEAPTCYTRTSRRHSWGMTYPLTRFRQGRTEAEEFDDPTGNTCGDDSANAQAPGQHEPKTKTVEPQEEAYCHILGKHPTLLTYLCIFGQAK